jgi:hypothetical protein
MRCKANLAFRQPTQKKTWKKQILRHYVWYGTCHNRHQLHLLKYKPCHTECPWQLPKTCVRHAGMGQIVKPRVPSISYDLTSSKWVTVTGCWPQ